MVSRTIIINSKTNSYLMKDDDSGIFAKHYDQIYLNMKDYKKEAAVIKNVIRQLEKKESRTLLDVGCGTGEHLKHLSSDFQCAGIDINRNMIKTANDKVPNAKFKIGNMIDFRLKERFDVIISLFSSIGYVQNFKNLVKTLENFHRHLDHKGLVMVEPWVFKKDFRKGSIGLSTFEDEGVKLARMGTSEIVGSKWFVFFHYLIGKGGKIEYVREVHRMLAVDNQDYIKAFESAGFTDTKFLRENLWDGCRGLFIAAK